MTVERVDYLWRAEELSPARYGPACFGIGRAEDAARVVSPEASNPTGSPARSGSPHGRRIAGIPNEAREIRPGGR